MQSTKEENEIAALDDTIKYQYDTLFTYKSIQKKPRDWQAHLERISDFLLEGEGAWWKKTEFGVEFNDYSKLNNLPSQPRLQHFRSSKIKDVENKLEQDWKKLKNSMKVIPISFLYIDNESEKVLRNDLQPYINHTITNISNNHSPTHDKNNNTDFEELENDEIVYFQTEPKVNIEQLPEENEDSEKEQTTNFEIITETEAATTGITQIPIAGCLQQPKVIREKEEEKSLQIVPEKVQTDRRNKTPKVSYEKKGRKALSNADSKWMEKVLNDCPLELLKYDTIKSCFKKGKSSVHDVEKQLAPLQTKVLRVVTELEKLIESWERDFVQKNNFSMPTRKDRMDNHEIFALENRLKIGKTLINKIWHIKF